MQPNIEMNSQSGELKNEMNLTQPTNNNEQKKSFLYIGHALVKTKKCMSLYNESFIAKNYTSAKEFLFDRSASKETMPSLIIVDIPYNQKELTSFVTWIKEVHQLDTPVIYNESAIPANLIKQLSSLRLVDDIVKVENYCNRLHEKAKFLLKAKQYVKEPVSVEELHSRFYQWEMNISGIPALKRIFDILVASAAILFFLPLFILIAIAIKIESKGPIIYSSYRAGRGFRIFKFLKFRTMVQDADKKVSELADLNMYDNSTDAPTFFKIKNDPRITKVGTFLRNTSLDELPQFFNVLFGDMSIVGNRPLPLYEAAALTTNEWSERFMAPAGITGLWQVSKRGKAEMSAEERILLDIDYARHHSFKSDFMIMLKTPTALIQKTNV